MSKLRIQRGWGLLAACGVLLAIAGCGDSKATPEAPAPPKGEPCEVDNVRVELLEDYRPAVGRQVPFPADLRSWKIEGASGELVTPPKGQPGQPALRLKVESNIALKFPGPHDLAHMQALAFVAWITPKRPIEARLHVRNGDQSWQTESLSYAQAGEGWELFRLPLPPEAVKAAHADELVIELTGEVAGDIALETPVFEWVVAPTWKALLDGDLKQPRAVKMSDGTRTAFGLVPGRVLRLRAKIPVDGGEVSFASGSIEPARGKPARAGFTVTVHHADHRVGREQLMLQTRNKWTESRVKFQGKAGETVEIEIEFMLEGPGSLCAAVTVPEVTAP